MSSARDVTDQNFDTEVLASEKPIMVDFWAEWCGPCKMIAPVLDQVAEQYGDKITIDAESNAITVNLTDEELAARKQAWAMPPYKFNRGTLYKYIKNVTSASIGCVTDE